MFLSSDHLQAATRRQSAPSPRRLRRTTVTLALLLALSACGGSGGGPKGDDPTGQCAELLNANVSVPRTLSNHAAGCDYLVEGELRVHAALSIEAGTEVRFAQDSRLTFSGGGSLQALGTATEPVLLRGVENVQGYWFGLCFGDAGSSRLEHVVLRNAGKVLTGGSLACRGAIGSVGAFTSQPVSMVATMISGSQTSGLDAARLPLGEFQRNVFADNAEYGVRVAAAYASVLDAASDYVGASVDAPNGRPYVYLAGTLNQPGSHHTWRALNAPWFTGGDEEPYGFYVIIDNDSHVEVEPGATFYFAERGGLTVDRNSTFTAVGSPDAPVVFTSQAESPGSWLGLLSRDAALHLEHAEVSWAGADRGSYAGAVLVTGVRTNQTSSVFRTLIRGSASCGLYANSNTEAFLDHGENTFEQNGANLCLP